MLFLIIKCECIQPCKPGAEIYTHYIVHYSVCVCVSERESLLFPKTCPKRINRVKLSVVESGYVCLLSEESLCEVLARCASLAGGDRGDLILCIPA